MASPAGFEPRVFPQKAGRPGPKLDDGDKSSLGDSQRRVKPLTPCGLRGQAEGHPWSVTRNP